MKAVDTKDGAEPIRVDDVKLQIQNAVYYSMMFKGCE